MGEEITKKGKDRMIEILKIHGIEMKVGGCGCCGSPWVEFKYNGETIFDDDEAAFDTDEVTPNAKLTRLRNGVERRVRRRTDWRKGADMTATKDEISDWFDRGVAQKATHMIVVCDTYDREDYPCFANSDADAIEQHSYYDGKNMQRVMEVYDLRANKTEQMNEHRAMRLPKMHNVEITGAASSRPLD